MADVYNNMAQIENLVQDVTTQMLGYNIIDNPDKVRVAWPTGGAPAWKIQDDVVFVKVTPIPDNYTRQRHVSYSEYNSTLVNKTVKQTRVYSIKWICYGPNSCENIEKINSGVWLQQFRELMAQKNMYLVTEVDMPVRFPELYNGQWWDRYDLEAKYYEGTERNVSVGKFDSINIVVVQNESETWKDATPWNDNNFWKG